MVALVVPRGWRVQISFLKHVSYRLGMVEGSESVLIIQVIPVCWCLCIGLVLLEHEYISLVSGLVCVYFFKPSILLHVMILKTALQLPCVVLVIILWCFYFLPLPSGIHGVSVACRSTQTVLLQVTKEKLSHHLYFSGIY